MRVKFLAQIKSSLDKDLTIMEKLSLLPVVEKIFDLYYDIRARIEWTRRAFAYAKLGYKNYDFDALTIEHYLLFKLKRVQDCLINGSCDLTVEMGPKKMKAIKLAIKLLERLTGSYEFHRFIDLHEAKWGELHTWFEPSEDGRGSYWRSSRPKANTPELIEQERQEFLEAARADDREEEKYRKLLYAIIAKYIRYWWD